MAQPDTSENTTLSKTGPTFTKTSNTSPPTKHSPRLEPNEHDLIPQISNNGLDTLVDRDVEKAEATNDVQDDKQEDFVSTAFYCGIC